MTMYSEKHDMPRQLHFGFFFFLLILACSTSSYIYIVLPFLLVYYNSLAHMSISNISLNTDIMSQLLGHDEGASISEKIITF